MKIIITIIFFLFSFITSLKLIPDTFKITSKQNNCTINATKIRVSTSKVNQRVKILYSSSNESCIKDVEYITIYDKNNNIHKTLFPQSIIFEDNSKDLYAKLGKSPLKNPNFQFDKIFLDDSIFEVETIPNWRSNQRLKLKVSLILEDNLVQRESSAVYINNNMTLSQNFNFSSFLYEENCNFTIQYGYKEDVDQSSSVDILINNEIIQVLSPNNNDYNEMKTVNFKFNMTKLENKLDIIGSNNIKNNTFYLNKVDIKCEV